MTNCTCGVAKRIFHDAYRSLTFPPTHGISEESVRLEEELRLYDYVFTPNRPKRVFLPRGRRLSARSFEFRLGPRPLHNVGDRTTSSGPIMALFVGTVCIGKGVPQLLKAWKQSWIEGRLILVGKIAKEMKPFIGPY